MTQRRRPTRRDLLVVVGQLQDAIGRLSAVTNNDRSPTRADDLKPLFAAAFDLCVAATAHDPPLTARLGPWGEPRISQTGRLGAQTHSVRRCSEHGGGGFVSDCVDCRGAG